MIIAAATAFAAVFVGDFTVVTVFAIGNVFVDWFGVGVVVCERVDIIGIAVAAVEVVVSAVGGCFDVLKVSWILLHMLVCSASLYDLVIEEKVTAFGVVALAFAKGETPFVSA